MEAPTERLQRLLDGSSCWTALERHAEVSSTSDVVLERAAAGAPPGLVVVAEQQTAGRGRAGRRWEDRPGGSLLLSCLLAPPASAPGLVPLAAGLATRGALCAQGADAGLRWPNDVLLDGRKCAGILVERHAAAGGDVVVVGIGLNVDWRGADRSGDAASWTSVAEHTGHDHDRLDLLADLLAELDAWLAHLQADPQALVAVYRTYCATLGREVEVTTPAGVVTGTAARIDGRGALVVDTPGGEVTVTAGDVVHARQA